MMDFDIKLEIGAGMVVLDGEIARIDNPQQFETPWELPISVFCTYSDEDGFRDWIGDYAIAPLLGYLIKSERVIGFNHIRFDYGVIDGGLIRTYNTGNDGLLSQMRKVLDGHFDIGEREPEPRMTERILRGKNVDIFQDVTDYLNRLGYPWKGRHANLDTIAKGVLDEGKVYQRFADGGAGAPKAWRQRMCYEVIMYCRYDVLRTAQLYKALTETGDLKNEGWPTVGLNEFKDKISLRVR